MCVAVVVASLKQKSCSSSSQAQTFGLDSVSGDTRAVKRKNLSRSCWTVPYTDSSGRAITPGDGTALVNVLCTAASRSNQVWRIQKAVSRVLSTRIRTTTTPTAAPSAGAGARGFRAIRVPGSFAVQFGWAPSAGGGVSYWGLYADGDFTAPVAGAGRISASTRVLVGRSRVWPPRRGGSVVYHLVPFDSSGAQLRARAVSATVPAVPNIDAYGPRAATAAPRMGEAAAYRTGAGVTVMWGDVRPGSAATESGASRDVNDYTFGRLEIEFTSGSSTWTRRISLTGGQAAPVIDSTQGRVWHDGYLGGHHHEAHGTALARNAQASVRIRVQGRADGGPWLFSPWTNPITIPAPDPPKRPRPDKPKDDTHATQPPQQLRRHIAGGADTGQHSLLHHRPNNHHRPHRRNTRTKRHHPHTRRHPGTRQRHRHNTGRHTKPRRHHSHIRRWYHHGTNRHTRTRHPNHRTLHIGTLSRIQTYNIGSDPFYISRPYFDQSQ